MNREFSLPMSIDTKHRATLERDRRVVCWNRVSGSSPTERAHCTYKERRPSIETLGTHSRRYRRWILPWPEGCYTAGAGRKETNRGRERDAVLPVRLPGVQFGRNEGP